MNTNTEKKLESFWKKYAPLPAPTTSTSAASAPALVEDTEDDEGQFDEIESKRSKVCSFLHWFYQPDSPKGDWEFEPFLDNENIKAPLEAYGLTGKYVLAIKITNFTFETLDTLGYQGAAVMSHKQLAMNIALGQPDGRSPRFHDESKHFEHGYYVYLDKLLDVWTLSHKRFLEICKKILAGEDKADIRYGSFKHGQFREASFVPTYRWVRLGNLKDMKTDPSDVFDTSTTVILTGQAVDKDEIINND